MKLTALETRLLAANGGRPFSLSDIEAMSLREARAINATARGAIGMTRAPGQWATTSAHNTKLAIDADAPGAGITYSPAGELHRTIIGAIGTGAALAGRFRAPVSETELCALLGISALELPTFLRRMNPCPRATPGCSGACVIATAGKGPMAEVVAGRCGRSLTLLADARAAFRLTAEAMHSWHAATEGHGVWRHGVGDDIRIEMVAPGLLELQYALGQAAYAYTKWSAEDRPDVPGLLRFTRSATLEGGRWPIARILDYIARGMNVAMVVNVPRGAPLPQYWHGVRVIDGDKSDNRAADPAGCIIMLRAKGAARALAAGGRSFVYDISARPSDERYVSIG